MPALPAGMRPATRALSAPSIPPGFAATASDSRRPGTAGTALSCDQLPGMRKDRLREETVAAFEPPPGASTTPRSAAAITAGMSSRAAFGTLVPLDLATGAGAFSAGAGAVGAEADAAVAAPAAAAAAAGAAFAGAAFAGATGTSLAGAAGA